MDNILKLDITQPLPVIIRKGNDYAVKFEFWRVDGATYDLTGHALSWIVYEAEGSPDNTDDIVQTFLATVTSNFATFLLNKSDFTRARKERHVFRVVMPSGKTKDWFLGPWDVTNELPISQVEALNKIVINAGDTVIKMELSGHFETPSGTEDIDLTELTNTVLAGFDQYN